MISEQNGTDSETKRDTLRTELRTITDRIPTQSDTNNGTKRDKIKN